MARSLLVLLLLLNYLLVVCASVAPQAGIAAARPFDYVHSPDCQLKNAWRGGTCFDDCNGVQYHVQKGHKPLPLQQLLTSLKGLDLHCLPPVVAAVALPVQWRAARPVAGREVAVPSGVHDRLDDPPRRG
ncbi:hypothetical protein [Hymenobacter psoromatis]|uniref:hypothetical protein n=1 Tax=Hymenobacter psoromatis TaxID=1484116 RepID=UPI001CBFC202|nr:hypothetical protein [Hymenobacter psoromatis]